MLLRFPLTAGCLVLSVSAGLIQHPKRDLQGLARAFDKIFRGLDELASKVENYAGAAGNAGVLAANDKIVTEINTGAAEIKKSKTMAVPDLLNIFGPVAVMENNVGELITLLGKNKDKLKAGNLPVLDMLMKDRKAADGLVNSIKANLPLQIVVAPIAGPIAATITNQLDRGIKEWGGTPPAAAASTDGGLFGTLTSTFGSLPGLGGLGLGSPKGSSGSAAPKAASGSGSPKASGSKSSPKKASSAPKSGAPPASADADAGMAGMAGMSHGARRL